MSFEQKRNAERLPLQEPLDATAGGVPVKIVELSAIGCRIEHREKLPIGGTTTLRFLWKSRPVEAKGKLARTQLRSTGGALVYESGLKFADSLDDAPPELRELITDVIDTKITTAEVPAIAEPRTTAGEDTLRRLRRATERESALPLEAFAPVDEPIGADLASEADEPPAANNPFASQAEAVALAVEPPPAQVEAPAAEYVECRLENGEWHRRIVHSLLQPAEGFVTLPGDDRELAMLCKSYEYADPETRRLIRISLELAATKK